MAGSRIYKLGSIFTRVEGLLKAGGMQPSEQPLWLDVYRAFPPMEEPSFYRTARGDVRRIFYPEDVTRMPLPKQRSTPQLPHHVHILPDTANNADANLSCKAHRTFSSTEIKQLRRL
ncbi:small ribosomal subunit protein mS23 isoform X1 [Dermacentor albipictus]|uniref:small ribosomal subunit protein mS23 isoform X1 n=1 Tax=Dermacentor albipictus TaxID=60249 RepID=UPI0038FC768D